MVAEVGAIASLLKSVAWPVAAVVIMLAFRSEVRVLLVRLRKAGPTSLEFDAPTQQAAIKTELTPATLKQLPGVSRTNALVSLELSLRQNLNQTPDADRLDLVVRELAVARLSVHFERAYRAVFGSQLLLLRRIHERGALSLQNVKEHYNVVSANYPEVYSKYSLHDWIKFMLNELLVTIEAGDMQITLIGKDFLLYLTVNALSDAKPY